MAENAEIIERLNFYIDSKKGNKSALARDMGVSAPQLSQVLKGTRGLSSTMLKKALAGGYNTTWLLTGQGDPFLPGAKSDASQIYQNSSSQRDELLASKDKIIELLEGKVEKLEAELKRKKVLGATTKTNRLNIVQYPVEAC
tara:strand:+ start:59 stop:484 length:426 start_codon:yes stop_codon:yes gene_type:complete